MGGDDEVLLRRGKVKVHNTPCRMGGERRGGKEGRRGGDVCVCTVVITMGYVDEWRGKGKGRGGRGGERQGKVGWLGWVGGRGGEGGKAREGER
jgi:hypothetical protein